MYEEKIIPNHTVADLFGNILNFGIGFFIDSITELLWNLTTLQMLTDKRQTN